MPSEALRVRVSIVENFVELVFNQLLGDQPMGGVLGDPDTERVVSSEFAWALERLNAIGVQDAKISPQNRLTFSFLPGLDAIELAVQVSCVVGDFHSKTLVLYVVQ